MYSLCLPSLYVTKRQMVLLSWLWPCFILFFALHDKTSLCVIYLFVVCLYQAVLMNTCICTVSTTDQITMDNVKRFA